MNLSSQGWALLNDGKKFQNAQIVLDRLVILSWFILFILERLNCFNAAQKIRHSWKVLMIKKKVWGRL
jgi:hypothetical protein